MADEYTRGWLAYRDYQREWRDANAAGTGWRLIALVAAIFTIVPLGVAWLAYNGVPLRDGAPMTAAVMLISCAGITVAAWRRSEKAHRTTMAAFHQRWPARAESEIQRLRKEGE